MTAEDWASRIGPSAATSIREALRYNRIGGLFGLAFLVILVASQVANSTAGIAVSVIAFVGMAVFFVRNFRTMAVARRQAATHLSLPASFGKYIPMRSTQLFDWWIGGRGSDKWPRGAPRRYRQA